jgi:hypothetical protein
VDAANVFSQSEHIPQKHVRKHGNNAAELQDLIQRVLHHPDFHAADVDHDLHERLMRAVEVGDIKVIEMWEEGENYGQELQIPPKRDLEWTAGKLNAILENNLVPSHSGKGQLRTFGCIQWECEHYSGRPKGRCYPFNMAGHRFRGKNRQVLHMI